MTRDLPFDDASDTEDNGGDAAYQIANGVARVARAGAYVTGGALIAAGGARGGTPAIDHDSKNVGWSQVNDPQPEVPSPTITFPDLTPDSMPPAHHGPAAALPVNSPFAHVDNAQHGTDAGMFPTSFDSIPQPDNSMSGFHGLGLPDNGSPATGLPTYGPRPGFGLPLEDNKGSDAGTEQPHVPGPERPGFSLPGADDGFGLPGADGGFGLPGANGGFHLPGAANGFHLPGADGMHLPGTPSAIATPATPGHTGGAFDGVGGTAGQGTGVFVGTDWSFDAHIGLDGAWIHSNLQVDMGVGAVGHQLDAFGQQMGQGISHIPANTTLPNNGGAPSLPGAGTPNNMGTPFNSAGSATPAANIVPGHGTSDQSTSASPTSAVPGANSPAASTGAPLSASTSPVGALGAPSPVAASAPMSLGTSPVAPAAPAAPMALPTTPVAAPVAPAPAAPVAVAPVVVAQPVAVTPLQTTIQPDAANQPIANLLSTHGGPSPLTAPAAVAPALFEHGRQPVPVGSGPSTPAHPTTLADKSAPVTPVPTPAPHGSTPAKADPTPGLTTAPVIPTIPKIPGLDTDTTKPGVSTPVTTPATPPTNTGGKDDPTTKPHTPTDDAGTHGGTPTVTPGDDSVPTHQPTVTNPAHPTQPEVSVPTVAPTTPEVTGHGGQPTVSVAPTPSVAPAPTQPLTNPAHVDPQPPVKPIAAQYDSTQHVMPVADFADHQPLAVHDAGLLVHDGGLFGSLTPDASFVDSHSPAQGPGDHMLLL